MSLAVWQTDDKNNNDYFFNFLIFYKILIIRFNNYFIKHKMANTFGLIVSGRLVYSVMYNECFSF